MFGKPILAKFLRVHPHTLTPPLLTRSHTPTRGRVLVTGGGEGGVSEEPEQWLRHYSEAGSSWSTWSKASHPPLQVRHVVGKPILSKFLRV